MELPILYEDADLVAVAKPAGVMTHADGRSAAETAEDWFKQRYPDAGLERPYAHRLDRETSGVLVFAKNPVAYDALRAAFTDRQVKKTYLAIVYGVPKEKKGAIDFDIGRSRKDFRLRSAQPKARGRLREAVTRYEVVAEADDRALLVVSPETGRTHQIRVHLKAIHHPVVCDPLYAPNRPCDLGASRLALHAYALDLPLPSGGRATVTAPVPSDLAPAFARFPSARGKFALAENA
ncbi:MAG TPA: RluA family pseudouridine synthase [Candidatus Paceibacterota bacterium]|nr:RluA family pseudouridine synthase [Candidatus Paceibacterota bacterium]